MRVHVGLPVTDLAASVDFYRRFLGRSPSRVLPGYAQFLLDEPALNLALTATKAAETGEGAAPPATPGYHFGIEVESVAAVRSALQRVQNSGLKAKAETDVLCCYSRQEKFWVEDPDGHRWEVFFVAERYSSDEPGSGCCEPAGASACCAGCCAG
ncbi:hypothetical protein DYI95_007260 [Thermaerobacter sp. PB12/4term]|uniref:ArsI/CadI family heavy metal resistance metalloenzyme n=1 Tax=Thermaerobacter sp. PB12/4term TaxID=2293838 RepID=UPI000E3295BC|nr:ArsI/CadI family heavy metal resistance metalloenzyme [Thermaerobacter sp. PB12/4term]QIA27356.1 hypothetical protein DYI95_007260 [Thermaerobacter sp. PB12/4term]